MQKKIDINSDMGEGFGNYKVGNDEEIMKHITSANVACGYHAGDPLIMRKTVKLAKQHGVAIGAHVGLPDLMGFGRREMKISVEEAKCYTIYQIGALKAFVEAVGMRLHHFKPHGAFWRISRLDEDIARAVLQGVEEADPKLNLIYCPAPISLFIYNKIAEELGMKVIGEFYVDLQYAPDGKTVSPRVSADLAVNPVKAAKRVIRYIDEGKVKAIDSVDIELGEVGSLCVHGDSPVAIEVLRVLRSELKKVNIEVKAK
ncbi:MAG: 5-oxoprolinase subunit PxpA [Nitrososphaeria archaeon]|nr:5-oxoprolinase subunit PxpA [Nitrososphaeria archaeon]NIQ34176.1 5-oxoprolinase subunit PxpA [Nitrososphaeria archaeon]